MAENEVMLCPALKDLDTKKTILFVCTGNTCRSPMAAALFNHLFKDSPYLASSAGLYADGSPISENALAALMEKGVLPTQNNDYRNHISRQLDEKLVNEAGMIVGITGSHAMEIIFRYPASASKVAVMPEDVPDPYGGGIDVYRECLNKMEELLKVSFRENTSEGEKHE